MAELLKPEPTHWSPEHKAVINALMDTNRSPSEVADVVDLIAPLPPEELEKLRGPLPTTWSNGDRILIQLAMNAGRNLQELQEIIRSTATRKPEETLREIVREIDGLMRETDRRQPSEEDLMSW